MAEASANEDGVPWEIRPAQLALDVLTGNPAPVFQASAELALAPLRSPNRATAAAGGGGDIVGGAPRAARGADNVCEVAALARRHRNPRRYRRGDAEGNAIARARGAAATTAPARPRRRRRPLPSRPRRRRSRRRRPLPSRPRRLRPSRPPPPPPVEAPPPPPAETPPPPPVEAPPPPPVEAPPPPPPVEPPPPRIVAPRPPKIEPPPPPRPQPKPQVKPAPVRPAAAEPAVPKSAAPSAAARSAAPSAAPSKPAGPKADIGAYRSSLFARKSGCRSLSGGGARARRVGRCDGQFFHGRGRAGGLRQPRAIERRPCAGRRCGRHRAPRQPLAAPARGGAARLYRSDTLSLALRACAAPARALSPTENSEKISSGKAGYLVASARGKTASGQGARRRERTNHASQNSLRAKKICKKRL